MKNLVVLMVAVVAMVLGLSSAVMAQELGVKCSAPEPEKDYCPSQEDLQETPVPSGLVEIKVESCGNFGLVRISCICRSGEVVTFPLKDAKCLGMNSKAIRMYCLQGEGVCPEPATKPTAKKRDPVVDFDEPVATQNPSEVVQVVCYPPRDDLGGSLFCHVVLNSEDYSYCKMRDMICDGDFKSKLKSGQFCVGMIECTLTPAKQKGQK